MKQRRKMVDGATLHRRGEHEWCGRIGGYDIIFTAYLGRYNRKVNGWHASSEAVFPTTERNARPVFSTSGNTLTLCVNRAQEFFGSKHAARPDFELFQGAAWS